MPAGTTLGLNPDKMQELIGAFNNLKTELLGVRDRLTTQVTTVTTAPTPVEGWCGPDASKFHDDWQTWAQQFTSNLETGFQAFTKTLTDQVAEQQAASGH